MATAAFCCVFLRSHHNASRRNRRARVIDCNCASRGGGPAARTWDPRFTPRPRHRAAAVNTATDDSRRPSKKQHYLYCGVREVWGGGCSVTSTSYVIFIKCDNERVLLGSTQYTTTFSYSEHVGPSSRMFIQKTWLWARVVKSRSGVCSIINYADISKNWDSTVCLDYNNWL